MLSLCLYLRIEQQWQSKTRWELRRHIRANVRDSNRMWPCCRATAVMAAMAAMVGDGRSRTSDMWVQISIIQRPLQANERRCTIPLLYPLSYISQVRIADC